MKNRYQQAVDTKKRRPLSVQMRYRLREGLFLLATACAVFLLIALLSYHNDDPGWLSTGINTKAANWAGRVGAWLSDVFFSLFGIVAYIFPFLILISSWMKLDEQDRLQKGSREWILTSIGWVLLVSGATGLVHFYLHYSFHLPVSAGGIIGDMLGKTLSLFFNRAGSTLLFFAFLLCGITLVTGLSWFNLLEALGEKVHRLWDNLHISRETFTKFFRKAERPSDSITSIAKEGVSRQFSVRKEPVLMNEIIPLPISTPALKEPTIIQKIEPIREKKKPLKIDVDPKMKLAPGTLPPFSLLNPPAVMPEKSFTNVSLEALSSLVEERLADFGVEVKVVAVLPGPVITRFELELAPGIKVSKITGLAKDIARSLSTVSVRVVDVIPGKSVIGLEIPNENRELVCLRELLESQRYAQSRSPVSLALGKDISGHPIIVDLSKMPHLLAAGTTGSGKSVSLNAMLLSMLFKSTPEQLRLILIDPKMLELSLYEGIPHLLAPVITDMKDAVNALRWCVAEMDRRYRLMASLGVRHLMGYNQKINDAAKQGEKIPLPSSLVSSESPENQYYHPLPMIVVVADELADMMMVVGKKVEDLIARIAQKARAAGIHLIIATQRPSVDVITGLIKANIPTRIAFQVSSRIDSRTILDQQGAEQLLGHGDMLYLPPGVGVPVRIHGAYVADEEVHRVVAVWRASGQPEYVYEVTE